MVHMNSEGSLARLALKRYWEIEILGGRRMAWFKLWRRVRRSRSAHFLFWFRLADSLARQNNRTLKSIAKGINNRLIVRHGIEIMLGANIGPGLTLSHMQGIVIFRTVNIGKNFVIRQNTTIGSSFKNDQQLLIGNNVDVGANSCIIGNGICIGDDVTIGAMSFVNKDIPSQSVYYTEKVGKLKRK